MGEPELKQWELWVGKLCQEEINSVTDAKINSTFNA